MGRTLQTIPRRLLGSELKRLRLQAGRSQAEAGRVIGKDQGRITKLEDGQTNLRPEELAALLSFLGAGETDREKIMAMGAEARKRQPRMRAYVDPLPDSYRRLANLETQASTILTYENGIFPGLLQCAEYAEALMVACDGLWWASSYQERANRVAFRLERQRLVLGAPQPKQLDFIVTDDALHTEFGSPQVMRRQFEHVLRIIAERPTVTVRLLSSTTPNSPSPHGGFTLLEFEKPAPSVGFVSVAHGPSPYMDAPADTNALSRVFNRLQDLSLGLAESKTVLADTLRRT